MEVQLEPAMPAAAAMGRVYRVLLDAIRASEKGFRSSLALEPLHDFRVAVRRTRAGLTQVGSVLPTATAERFKREFSWLGKLTGPVRDLDVHLEVLERRRAALPAAAAELEPLRQLLAARRDGERRQLIQTLDGSRYRRLLEDWSELVGNCDNPGAGRGSAADAGPAPADARRPIAEVAAARVARCRDRVLDRGRKIGSGSAARKLHRLRIDCKKLRYLLEFFASLWERGDVRPIVTALKRLQDSLGEFNDCEVQRQALFGLDAGALPGDEAGGRRQAALLERLERRQGEARRAFEERFARFASAEVQDRFGRLARERQDPSS